MTQTLTQLISSLQAQLIDDGTRFNTATCTAAIRTALAAWNQQVPVFAADLIEVVDEQKEYEVSAVDSRAQKLLGVWEKDDDGEEDIPLAFKDYMEDERLFFRLRYA